MKTGLTFAFALALILVFVGCSATSNTSSGSSSGSPALKSLQVKAASSSVPAGLTLQLTATGIYSDGSSQDLTSSVSWTSSVPSVATISAGGLLTAKTTGSVTVTASSGSISGARNVSVGNAIVASLSAINPSNVRIAANTKQQLHAMATMTDGSSLDVTDLVTWSVSGGVATISNSIPKGTVTAGSPSSPTTVSVTATCGAGCQAKSGQPSASTSLTVTNALATSIAVTPASQTIGWGSQQQFVALGTFDDGSKQDITTSCTWSSGNSSILFITSSSGLGIGKSVGTTSVQAKFESVSGNAGPIIVDLSNLTGVSVTPPSSMIAVGTQAQFAAIGTFQDGSTRNLYSSNAVTWSTLDSSVATIANSGIAQGAGAGVTTAVATVTAGANTFTGSANLDVENATLDSIAVAPATATIPLNAQLDFTAVGSFTGSNCSCQFQETITGQQQKTTWHSSSASVAINNQGVATGQATGTALLTASSSLPPGSVTSNAASLTVSSVHLTSVGVNPANTFIPPGATMQYSAIGYYSDGTSQSLTPQVTWSASPSSVATIVSWGQATGQGQGNATITATCSNASTSSCNPGGAAALSNSTNLLVTSAYLQSILISPASPTIATGTATQLTATGKFSNGKNQDLTGSVNWSSSAHSVGTIGAQSGILTAFAPGQTTVTASFGSVSSSTTVTVTNATLESITVSPNPATVNLGGSQTFMAVGHFQEGTTQTTQSLINVTWNSSNANVAIITSFGLATSSGQTGSTNISATLNGVTGTAVLTVP